MWLITQECCMICAVVVMKTLECIWGKKLIISSIGLYVLESEATTPDAGSVKPLNNEPIKPHEQRALNFLVNEYLLLHGYKLTSITFADENENQVCYC
jgi:hypothetical protein